MEKVLRNLLLLCVALALSGCAILGKLNALSQNNQELDEVATIVGTLPTQGWPLGDVNVVLLDVAATRPLVIASCLLNEGGFFTFKTERSGQFQVLAFHDRNHDGVWSRGE